jgi:hypothetical protein
MERSPTSGYRFLIAVRVRSVWADTLFSQLITGITKSRLPMHPKITLRVAVLKFRRRTIPAIANSGKPVRGYGGESILQQCQNRTVSPMILFWTVPPLNTSLLAREI